jgi:predicted Zn finger-like uncharacterized protein
LIIECPQCQAKYQYSEDRFDGKASKKIRCAKCQTIFGVKNPAMAEEKPEPKAAKPSAAKTGKSPAPKTSEPEHFDSTVARREPGAATEKETTAVGGAPSTTTGRSEPAAKLSGSRRYSLAILDGPDAGKVYRIEQAKVVIGRSNADLTLDDIEASRHHACVEIRDPVVLLHDLESTNGTMFDGEKITRPVELHSHSEFTVGTTTLMLIVTADE